LTLLFAAAIEGLASVGGKNDLLNHSSVVYLWIEHCPIIGEGSPDANFVFVLQEEQ
jgi:hypothetical protein